MSWEDQADLVLRTAINAFKTQASYIRRADPGNPISLQCVYDIPYASIDPNTGAAVTSHIPSAGIRLADLPAPPAAGDQIIIKGKTYDVLDPQADGQGGSKLMLQEYS